MRKPVVALAAVLVLALVGLFVLRPWESGGDTREALDEALPTTGASAATEAPEEPLEAQVAESTEPSRPTERPEPRAVELARGEFEDAEYATSGTAKVIRLADGSRLLRIEDFSTSQAPVIQVALSNAPSGGEWDSYDDDRFATLGTLKALSGNQNYEIPEGLDLKGFTSVVIWCDKYDIALGTAPVRL